MAAPACMSDDGNPAVFVGTMLQTGDAVALCDECLVMWSAALLQQMTGVDPAPFIQAISEPEGAEFGGVGDAEPVERPPETPPEVWAAMQQQARDLASETANEADPTPQTPIPESGPTSSASPGPPTDIASAPRRRRAS